MVVSPHNMASTPREYPWFFLTSKVISVKNELVFQRKDKYALLCLVLSRILHLHCLLSTFPINLFGFHCIINIEKSKLFRLRIKIQKFPWELTFVSDINRFLHDSLNAHTLLLPESLGAVESMALNGGVFCCQKTTFVSEIKHWFKITKPPIPCFFIECLIKLPFVRIWWENSMIMLLSRRP